VVVIAVLGGGRAGFLAALIAFLLADYFVIAERRSFDIWEGEGLPSAVLFLAIAGGVTFLVQRWSRLGSEARRTRSQAETLLRVVGWLGHEEDPLGLFLDHVRASFGFSSVSVLKESEGAWTLEAASGEDPPLTPERATETVRLGDRSFLATVGPQLKGEEGQLMSILVPQMAVAVQNRTLKDRASEASEIADMNELRGAILNAVSHDLRNPLAGIKAAATSLMQDDVDWNAADREQFLETIDQETDRLNSLVGNLLDVSRLRTGAVGVFLQSCAIEDVVHGALESLGERKGKVVVDLPDPVALVNADPALLERAIANVTDNAFKWSPAGEAVRIDAYQTDEHVELRIIDKGPGIPEEERQRVAQAFERLGESGESMGFGLGLAVARGFVEAMRGRFSIEDTPGGGTTIVITLEVVKS
jgi:two-component system sensor histidine kinase KdpD